MVFVLVQWSHLYVATQLLVHYDTVSLLIAFLRFSLVKDIFKNGGYDLLPEVTLRASFLLELLFISDGLLYLPPSFSPENT